MLSIVKAKNTKPRRKAARANCLTTNDIDAASVDAAYDFLQAGEDFAIELAQSFDAGSTIKLGPVRPRPHGASFDLVGTMDGAVVSVSIIVSPGMPEMDLWCSWSSGLERGGLVVDEDAGYQALVSEAADREMADIVGADDEDEVIVDEDSEVEVIAGADSEVEVLIDRPGVWMARVENPYAYAESLPEPLRTRILEFLRSEDRGA